MVTRSMTSPSDVSDSKASKFSGLKKKKKVKGKRTKNKLSISTETSPDLVPKKKAKKQLDVSSNTEHETSSQSLRRSSRNK